MTFKAPPHGLSPHGDSFPQGCPAGIDPIDVAKKMGKFVETFCFFKFEIKKFSNCFLKAQKGIILYCVGVEPPIIPYKDFFSAIAFMTGGQYVPVS